MLFTSNFYFYKAILFFSDLGIEQSDLETVIPKNSNALVFVVEGKYKGQVSWFSFSALL